MNPTSQRKPPEFKVVPMRQLGATLPVGIFTNGRYERSFGVRPFRLREEKAIGELRSRGRGLNTGRLVAEVLSKMCTHIGPYNFEEMKESERLLRISQMYLMDVLYVYVYLRVNALGDELPLMITCPNCRHTFKITTHLNDLDIRVLADQSLSDIGFEYELRDGIVIQEQTHNVLTIGFMPWHAMDVPELEGSNGLNPAMRDAAMLKAGIQAIDGEPVTVLDRDLDELTLYDKTGLMDAMSESMFGPVLFVQNQCPKCTLDTLQPIDWSYDSFFKRSSQSKTQNA
jgi:hypothetical protein